MTHVPSITSDRPSTPGDTLKGHQRWTYALQNARPKLKRRGSASSSDDDRTDNLSDKRFTSGGSRPSKHRWPASRRRTSSDDNHNAQAAERPATSRSRASTLKLQLPLPIPRAPYTVSHTKTPGWDTPWTPRVPPRAAIHNSSDPELGRITSRWTSGGNKEESSDDSSPQSRQTFKKKFRNYVLTNTYIPLVQFSSHFCENLLTSMFQVSRFINITFTTTALAIAVRIRQIEQNYNLMGAVGSSPSVIHPFRLSLVF